MPTLPADKPELQARLKPVLNQGAKMDIAAEGFRSGEQFAAVAHAARNTQIPFMVLKHRVVDERKTAGGDAWIRRATDSYGGERYPGSTLLFVPRGGKCCRAELVPWTTPPSPEQIDYALALWQGFDGGADLLAQFALLSLFLRIKLVGTQLNLCIEWHEAQAFAARHPVAFG